MEMEAQTKKNTQENTMILVTLHGKTAPLTARTPINFHTPALL